MFKLLVYIFIKLYTWFNIFQSRGISRGIFFAKVIDSSKPLTIFVKSFILDVLESSEYGCFKAHKISRKWNIPFIIKSSKLYMDLICLQTLSKKNFPLNLIHLPKERLPHFLFRFEYFLFVTSSELSVSESMLSYSESIVPLHPLVTKGRTSSW